MGVFFEDVSAESMVAWFQQRGETDVNYLAASLPRFKETLTFAKVNMGLMPLRILDIGAHWLHQSVLFANEGHSLICADVPNTSDHPSVRRVAEHIGATVISYRNLDRGEGIRDLAESSIDMVLFSEILEHIAFNPIPMWKAIYHVLKPGGRIVLTTPNATYFRSVTGAVRNLLDRHSLGIDIHSIMDAGTYGHHWKEYSLHEIKRYFELLTSDFNVIRWNTFGGPENDHRDLMAVLACGDTAGTSDGLAAATIRQMFNKGAQLLGSNLICEIELTGKISGISISPPWEPC